MTSATLLPFTIAFVVMTLIGYFIARAFCGQRFSAGLTWAFAASFGAGTCSLILFAFRRPMFTVEFGLLAALSVAWFVRNGMRPPSLSSLMTRRVSIIGLLLAGGLGWVLAVSFVRIDKMPHGDWDAWAIWNSHSRYLYRDGPAWQDHIQETFHADYPLLAPLMTARLWRYAGEDVPDMSGVFGIVFALSGVFLLGAALKESRGAVIGLLMALTLAGTPFYLSHAMNEGADIPLSIFMLATIALIVTYFDGPPDRLGLLAAAGLMAGFAGWTKNEGLVFILATAGALLLPVFWKPSATLRGFAAFAAGLLLPLAVIAFFKVTIAPPSEFTLNRHYAEVLEKITNPDRYMIIFGNVLKTSWAFGGWVLQPMIPLLAFVGLTGVDRTVLRSRGWLTGGAILMAVMAGYFAVYVVTPMELQWHLDSSLERLLMHFWPSVLFLAGYVTRVGGEARYT